MINPKRRGGARRALIIWAAVAATAAVGGPKIYHSFKPKKNEPAEIGRFEPKVERIIPHEIIESARPVPRYAAEIQSRNMYEGNKEQVIQRWREFAQRAYDEYRRMEVNPLPLMEVNKLCREIGTSAGVNPILLKAFFHKESLFDPYAVGPTMDIGAGQLNPVTLWELSSRGHRITNPFDPQQNLTGVALKIQAIAQRAQKEIIGNSKTGFISAPRRYEWEGQSVSFNELPPRYQVGIIASAYNRGEGNTFTNENQSSLGYNPSKICQFPYAVEIMKRWERFSRE